MTKTLNSLSFYNKPVGGASPFLVTMNGEPFAGFDTMKEAQKYIEMQRSKMKGANANALAADKSWDIRER